MTNPREEKALADKDIQPGDYVSTAYRGGTREGYVKDILTSQEETPHPPKVVFDIERGGNVKTVAHNPSTLQVHPERSKRGEAGGKEGVEAEGEEEEEEEEEEE